MLPVMSESLVAGLVIVASMGIPTQLNFDCGSCHALRKCELCKKSTNLLLWWVDVYMTPLKNMQF